MSFGFWFFYEKGSETKIIFLWPSSIMLSQLKVILQYFCCLIGTLYLIGIWNDMKGIYSFFLWAHYLNCREKDSRTRMESIHSSRAQSNIDWLLLWWGTILAFNGKVEFCVQVVFPSNVANSKHLMIAYFFLNFNRENLMLVICTSVSLCLKKKDQNCQKSFKMNLCNQLLWQSPMMFQLHSCSSGIHWKNIVHFVSFLKILLQ